MANLEDKMDQYYDSEKLCLDIYKFSGPLTGLSMELFLEEGYDDEFLIDTFSKFFNHLNTDICRLFMMCNGKTFKIFLHPKFPTKWYYFMNSYKINLTGLISSIKGDYKSIKILNHNYESDRLVNALYALEYESTFVVYGDDELSKYFYDKNLVKKIYNKNPYNNLTTVGVYVKHPKFI